MKTQFIVAAVAAFTTLVSAAPPTKFHQTVRLRLTTSDGQVKEQLAHTKGTGDMPEDGRVTKNQYGGLLISKVEIVGMDGKDPEYVLCGSYDLNGKEIDQDENSWALNSKDGRADSPAMFKPPVEISQFRCKNWWGD